MTVANLLTPTTPEIPEHELLRPIAAGAYGQVWLGRNSLGTLRAVKIVRGDRFERAEDFEREFRGLQRFEPVSRTHEGLVDILQIGREQAWFYYVMELADDFQDSKHEGREQKKGRTPKSEAHSQDRDVQNSDLGTPSGFGPRPLELYSPHTLRAELKARGALSAQEVITVGQRLACALAHLHAQGLVHRDVKPSNILFVDGQPKLADAGLVAAVGDARSLVGTPGFIPPEGPGTPQADIYSFGKVLYEAAFGKDRQDFPQLPADLAQHADHSSLLELNEVISKACAQDPRRRHSNALALVSELQLLQRGGSVKRRRLLAASWVIVKTVGWVGVLVSLIVMGTTLVVHKGETGLIEPKNPEVKKLVSQAFLFTEGFPRNHDAVKLYKQATELEPDFAPAWAGLVVAYFQEGAFDPNAPTELRLNLRNSIARLSDLRPDCAEAHNGRAILLWSDWRFPDALRESKASVTKHEIGKGGLEFAHGMYGFFLLRSGLPGDALKQIQKAAQYDPADAYVQFALGHPYFAMGNFDEALRKYNEVLKYMPSFWGAHLWKGRVFEEKHEFDEALREFEQCVLGTGKDPAMVRRDYDELRGALRQRGEQGYWEKRLELAKESSPQDLYYLSTLYARLDKAHAYRLLREACARRNFDPTLMFDRCWDLSDPEFQSIVRAIGLSPQNSIQRDQVKR